MVGFDVVVFQHELKTCPLWKFSDLTPTTNKVVLPDFTERPPFEVVLFYPELMCIGKLKSGEWASVTSRLFACCILVLLAACTISPTTQEPHGKLDTGFQRGNEVVIFALHLMDIDYKFGGANPDTGLDCSGMVSYVYRQSVGIQLPHSAKQIAKTSRVINLSEIKPGDLVFFNTLGQSYSHVGIYLGEGRFIHAPKRNGKIRTDSLRSGYFKDRLEAARTLF